MNTQQAIVILVVGGAGMVCYFALDLWNQKKASATDYLVFGFMCAGALAGGDVFLRALRTASESPELSVWSGLAGMCIMLATLSKVWRMLRDVRTRLGPKK